MTPLLLATLTASLAIQGGFFLVAAVWRTDRVTDLSYGLTFIALTGVLLAGGGEPTAAGWVLAAMVVVQASRLAAYLFWRIVRMGRDPRFDGIREDPARFARFWLLQGIVVWMLMLPVTLWFGSGNGRTWLVPGFGVWLAGLVIATIADLQKFRQKSRPEGSRRWMSSGLWRYSRHPNYFGELLSSWGIFLSVAPGLSWWIGAGALGPVCLTYLLLRVTGIPPLERSAEARWGDDPRYRAYRAATPLLVPRVGRLLA